MKNTKTKVLKRCSLLVIALVAIIGFSMAACGGDGGDGGGNGGGDGPSFLGETPTLSGRVYVEKWNDTISYQVYTGGNLTVLAENGIGQGTIKNGQLSITLGTPTFLDNLNKSIFYGSYGSGGGEDNTTEGSDGGRTRDSLDDSYYADLTVNPSTAKGNYLDLSIENSNYYLTRENLTLSSTSSTYESVSFLYVDSAVTISSIGKTKTYESSEEDYTAKYITKPFSLALQAGWNTVYCKSQVSVSGGTETYTSIYSLSNPGNLKWVLTEGLEPPEVGKQEP